MDLVHSLGPLTKALLFQPEINLCRLMLNTSMQISCQLRQYGMSLLDTRVLSLWGSKSTKTTFPELFKWTFEI